VTAPADPPPTDPPPASPPPADPPARDHVLGSGWLLYPSVRRFLELASFYVGYDFDDLDWQAIEAGIKGLRSEDDTFGYPIAGQRELAISLSKDPGGDEVILRIAGPPDELLAVRLSTLFDVLQR
jgi:hypothetical protein